MAHKECGLGSSTMRWDQSYVYFTCGLLFSILSICIELELTVICIKIDTFDCEMILFSLVYKIPSVAWVWNESTQGFWYKDRNAFPTIIVS